MVRDDADKSSSAELQGMRRLAAVLGVSLVQEHEGYVVARSPEAETALGYSNSSGIEQSLAELSGLAPGDPRIDSLLSTARHDGTATAIVRVGERELRLAAFRGTPEQGLFALVAPLETGIAAPVESDQALATVRHELANGLQALIGLASLGIRRSDAGEEFLVDVLRRIEHAATASAESARNAGKRIATAEHTLPEKKTAPSLPPPAIPLTSALRDLVTELEPYAESKGVTLEVRIHEGLELAVRESDLRSIVWNVIKNAVEATGEGGFVRVRAKGTTDGVKLSITDDGPGMDAETRAHALEPYFTTKSDGSGLGLPLVRHLVERAGGSLAIESAPGRGTRFTAIFATAPIESSVTVPRDTSVYAGSGVRARPALRGIRFRLVGLLAEALRPLLEAARATVLPSSSTEEAHVAFVDVRADSHIAASQVALSTRAIAVGPDDAMAPWAITVVSPEVALDTLVAVLRSIVPEIARALEEDKTGTHG